MSGFGIEFNSSRITITVLDGIKVFTNELPVMYLSRAVTIPFLVIDGVSINILIILLDFET